MNEWFKCYWKTCFSDAMSNVVMDHTFGRTNSAWGGG